MAPRKHPAGESCKRVLEMGDHPGEEEEKKPLPQEDGGEVKNNGTNTQKTRGKGKEEEKGDKTPEY